METPTIHLEPIWPPPYGAVPSASVDAPRDTGASVGASVPFAPVWPPPIASMPKATNPLVAGLARPAGERAGVTRGSRSTAMAESASVGLPPALARLEAAIFDGLPGRPDGDNRERDLVAIAETLSSVIEQRPTPRLREYARHGRIVEPLATLLADVRAFGADATDEDRVTAMTLLAATQFRLMANTTNNKLTLLFSGGARTKKRFGAASSYWTAIAAAGGPSPRAALDSMGGARGAKARDDFRGEWEVLRKVQPEPSQFPTISIARTPTRALQGAVLPAIATQERFGGERALGGIANGPLLQAAALVMFDRWAREDVVGVLTRSAGRGDPQAFETLLLLGDARRAFGSTLAPETAAHFELADDALRALSMSAPDQVARARAEVARLTGIAQAVEQPDISDR